MGGLNDPPVAYVYDSTNSDQRGVQEFLTKWTCMSMAIWLVVLLGLMVIN